MNKTKSICALAACALFFSAAGADMSSAYLAPENMLFSRLRLPDGTYVEFERGFDEPGALRGARGWKGRENGDDAVIAKGGREWKFHKGRLVSFADGNGRTDVPYGAKREAPGGKESPPYYFADAAGSADRSAKAAKTEMAGKWKKSRRMRWPFANPNENGFLFASLALLSLLALCRPGRAWKAAGTTSFLAFAALTALTASRGAMLALCLGLGPAFVLKADKLVRSKAFWISAALFALAAAAWFVPRNRLLTRGFGKGAWSNEARLEMWTAAPRMMADAPGGWKDYNAGRAYMDWYQPIDELSLPGSLMNDHLTRMARTSWPRRFDYAFVWAFAFVFLCWLAARTRSLAAAVAFGSWILLFAAGWFNPVTGSWWAFLPAAAATLAALPAAASAGARDLATGLMLSIVGAVAAAGAITLAVYARGSSWSFVRISSDGKRTVVNGPEAKAWVVDDGRALGGAMACKELRRWHTLHPSAPSVGYVRSVSDLPSGKIRRLVLAGKAGAEWMDSVRKLVESGAGFSFVPPYEVVFVSPEFPPSALPPEFVEMCRAKIVVGEFAAMYEPEYADPPPFVKVVPGMELYIEDWPALVAEGL